MTGLSGYPEFLPRQRIVETRVIATLAEAFEAWGFASIRTRSVEPLDVLLRKGEIDKEVYVVRRLHAAADDGDKLALHYDLTVPFARYVTEHAGHLAFPLRRYQIQQCWRGERPQEGRYREFTQADVDIVGDGTLAAHHDIEVAAAMADALGRLPLPPLTIRVNDRRLVEGFLHGVGVEDTAAALRVLDKRDKVDGSTLREMLASDIGLADGQIDAATAMAAVTGSDVADIVARVRSLGVVDPLLDEGLDGLVAVLSGLAQSATDRVRVVADLSVARGLDYYTSTVYETTLEGYESLGSICSGGRYDTLATLGNRTFPGVGISLGVTRLLVPILGRGVLTASRPTPTAVLVAVTDEEHRAVSDDVARSLRLRGISTYTAPKAAKFGAQIKHAERHGIPYVWFAGDDGDSVKDIRTGVQLASDAASWLPPEVDARPTITYEGERL